jgi:CheY-like chemotaxis protein
MRVLVIDDDHSVGAAIETLLRLEGCEVVFAERGPQGLQAFEESSFDSVIIDIFMPVMDGLETIEVFRKRNPTVPIIAMSGFRFRDTDGTIPDFLEMALKLGATYCLRKPFGAEQLMTVVNACSENAAPKNSVGR